MPQRKFNALLPLGLFLLSCFFLFWCSREIDPQSTFDSAYYHIMADQLEKGKGFCEPVIWNFLNHRSSIEAPMDYWMPLGIILYYLSRLIGGQNAEVALNIIIWSLISVSVFYRVKSSTENYFSAFFGFFSMLFAGRSIFYLLTTDNIAFYAAIGFCLFYFLGNRPLNPYKMALVCASALLMRIEGVLVVGFVVVFSFLRDRNARAVLLMLTLIAILASPWLWRNWTELETLWPSNHKALFLVEYNDIFCSDYSGSVERFLGQGLVRIFAQRVSGLITTFINLILVPGMIFFCFLWPFGFSEISHKEGKSLLGLLLFFFLFCGLIIPLQADRGTAMHISALFVPYFSVLNGIGINRLMKKSPKNIWLKSLPAILLMGWAMWFTLYSVQAMVKNQCLLNRPYQELKSILPQLKKNLVVSVSPIRVFHETGAKGVMISASSKLHAWQLAEKYGCDIIILDNRAEFKDWSVPEGFGKLASTSHLLIMQRQ